MVVAAEDDEESAGVRKQRVAEQYGFSNDVVERYIQAFHGDEAMAHRRMRATYVRLSMHSWHCWVEHCFLTGSDKPFPLLRAVVH